MSTIDDVLAVLTRADAPVSGERLARKLGVSRNSVWKAIEQLRQEGYQYNLPVSIGRNCWLGAGVIVLPGVTIGDDTVIGAGSVVTGDIPSGTVAAGCPCRVLRPVSDRDRIYYYRDRKIPSELLRQEDGSPTAMDAFQP